MPAFLTTLRDTANIRLSCSQAGIHRSTAYDRKESDPTFAAAWAEAIEESIDTLEAVARQRAIASSDTLIIFLLKCQRPRVYGDRLKIETEKAPFDIMKLPEAKRRELLEQIREARRLTEEPDRS